MRTCRIAGFVFACAMAASFAPAQAAPPAPGPATRPGTAVLIRQLGDPRFSVREAATAQLARTPFEELPDLARHFRQERRYDAKLRLRFAIETAFYTRRMSGQEGFLGMTLLALPGVYDSQTGQTVEGIIAVEVMEGKPAKISGMRARDVLLDIDGQPLLKLLSVPALNPAPRAQPVLPNRVPGFQRLTAPPADPFSEAFMNFVKRREPGSKVKVRVLRTGEARSVTVTVSDKPLEMATADVLTPTSLGGEHLALVGELDGGLAVKQVPRDSWLSACGLKPGEVIVGIATQPLPVGVAPGMLADVFNRVRAGGQVNLQVRSVEEVNLDVTIGARTPEYMNRSDWNDAQVDFAAWWREQMGEPSIRFRPYSYLANSTSSADPPDAEVVP